MLKDLQEIAELSDFRAILATHSPQIYQRQMGPDHRVEGAWPTVIVLTARELANEIRMTRSLFADSFLIVEGRDDKLFMDGYISPENCRIVVAIGKQNVCDAIGILDDDGFDGALGMVDADFDRVEGIPDRSRNLVMPECHDLVTMLVRSPALARVLREFGSQDKLDSFGKSVLDALIEIALPIGYLRLHSLRDDLNLRFRGLDYARWIDARSFQSPYGQADTSRQESLAKAGPVLRKSREGHR